MVQLIKNEFIKLFKLKSTRILLILFFVIVIGFSYKFSKDIKAEDDGYIFYEEEYIYYNDYNKEESLENILNSEYRSELEKIGDNYRYNSWQAYSFMINFDIITEVIGIDSENYNEIKKVYEKNDWKTYTNTFIKSLEKIDTKKDKNRSDWIQSTIETEKIRLENNIPYGYDYLNNALRNYNNNKNLLERFC